MNKTKIEREAMPKWTKINEFLTMTNFSQKKMTKIMNNFDVSPLSYIGRILIDFPNEISPKIDQFESSAQSEGMLDKMTKLIGG